MATSTKIAGTGASDNAVGTVAWADPGNITADDATRAVATTLDGTTSHYLKATNFAFAVPDGATVNGITVTIDRSKTGSGAVRDSTLRLVKAGTVSGDNKAATGVSWPITTDATATYGSASDLWGLTFTPAEINAADFGCVLSTAVTADDADSRVDYISITVHFTEAVGSSRMALLGVG